MRNRSVRSLAAFLSAVLLCALPACAPAASDPNGEGAGNDPPEIPAEAADPAPETEEPVSAEPEPEAEPETPPEPGVFPKGVQAKTVVTVSEPSDYSDKLTLATLEGLAARSSDTQILIKNGASDLYLPLIRKEWGAETTDRIGGKPPTVSNLLAAFSDQIDGYVLCSSDPADPSVSTAVSVAGLLNAVVVTEKNRSTAEKAGYSMILDVTGCNERWLRSSEYWDRLNRKIAFEQPASMAPKLVDYAVMTNAFFGFYDGHVTAGHTKMYEFLDDGAVIFGYNNTLGELETVRSYGSLNLQMVPADHAYNLSTLSGFRLDRIKQKGGGSEEEETPEAAHTLCVMMSDGDNLQWVLNNFATSSEWYGNPKRGKFPMAWGVSPAAIDTAAPMLSYLYGKATEKDEFVMQLSGLGYTFPSRWDPAARLDMAKELAKSMERADLKYAEILDDGGFKTESLKDFAAQPEIEGLFYIEYSWYASERGKILWLDGKPCVSARHMIWAGHPAGGLDYIARKINGASTDPKDEDAYTFLIVHAWSGMKNGKLAEHGNTMDAVAELLSMLDEDVEVVTPSVFMNRLIQNCAP